MNFKIAKGMATHPFRRHWRFSVGSGHAPMVLRADYARILKKVHEELGIRYVRFHGIFNDDMCIVSTMEDVLPFPGLSQFSEYNFHKIAAAYDNVLSCGMKPFVELSFMPKHLASGDSQCMFYYKGNITPPKDYGKWEEFITEFIRFLIHRYGKEEIESWYFEVWNEPDLFGFFSGKKIDYYKLYESTAKAIKKVDSAIRVGGPATSGSKWIGSFLDYCKTNNVPVDFVSTHQYAGDPVGGIDASIDFEEDNTPLDIASMSKAMEDNPFAKLPKGSVLDGLRMILPDKSETEDLSNQGFRMNSAMVKKQAGDLPVIYTEWNANAIFSAHTNDTRKVAAYDVKVSLDTEMSVDASSIWCFSDIFEEFHHFPEEFHGGFGMITSNGIPKPVYHAMKMLAEVSDNRIELGENATDGEIGIAAFRDDKSMQIILFRQKLKNLDLPKETAHIEIEWDRPAYRISLQRIDEEHCNPLNLWKEMGKPRDLTPAEVDDLIKKSAMKTEELSSSYENGTISFHAELGVNDIWMIKIS